MTDLLSTGISGVRTYQVALATVGNNITNADTEGYSRQRVQLVDNGVASQGALNIGTGVRAEQVQRQYNGFLAGALRTSESQLAHQSIAHQYAVELENQVADSRSNLTAAIDSYFEAVHELSTSPASLSARQNLLNVASVMVDRCQQLGQEMQRIDAQSMLDLQQNAEQLNTLSKQLVSVNAILNRNSQLKYQANDVLDQRDVILQDMAKLVRINVTEQANGSVDVYLGEVPGSQQIVSATRATGVGMQGDSLVLDPYRQPQPLTQIRGGSLGGLHEFRQQTLNSVRDELDEVVQVFADQVNRIQRLGIDGNNEFGSDFFTFQPAQRPLDGLQLALTSSASIAAGGAISVASVAANTSTSVIELQYYQQPPSGEMTLLRQAIDIVFDGSARQYDLYDSNNNVVATGNYSVGDIITYNGWTVALNGPVAANDRFEIRGNNYLAGDNRNLLQLANLQHQDLFAGRGDLTTVYTDMVGRLGSTVMQSAQGREVQQALVDQAQMRRDNVSAVNLDEEAADLLRFQQAYQASAQIISTANKLFETMINLG